MTDYVDSYVIMSEFYNVIWATYTRQNIVHNFEAFVAKMHTTGQMQIKEFCTRDFDSTTAWPSTRCPGGCSRILPIQLLQIDHFIPKAKIKHSYGEGDVHYTYAQNGTDVTWPANGVIHTLNYGPNASFIKHEFKTLSNGGALYVSLNTQSNQPSAGIPVQLLWENGLQNLRLMCGPCNASKNAHYE